MKKINFNLFVLLLSVILFSATNAEAQRKKKGSDEAESPKQIAAKFTARTAVIISGVAEFVDTKGDNKGYLKYAKELQNDAKSDLASEDLKSAVENSYLARRYAYLAYEASGGTVPQKWRMTPGEENQMNKHFAGIERPTDQQLKDSFGGGGGSGGDGHGRKKKED